MGTVTIVGDKERTFEIDMKNPLQSTLTLIFLTVIGKKRVNKVEKIKDHGITAFAGLPRVPSKSHLCEFLDLITVAGAEKFGIARAKEF